MLIDPLGICDGRSIPQKGFILVQRRYKYRTGEVYHIGGTRELTNKGLTGLLLRATGATVTVLLAGALLEVPSLATKEITRGVASGSWSVSS